MARYLVTGGAGFIGSNLVRRLVTFSPREKVHVIVEPECNLWRLHDLADQIEVTFVDLRNSAALDSAISALRPTHIFHLAAYGVISSDKDARLIYECNFNGTMNLVSSCKKVGFELFINTGSASEYGMHDVVVTEEAALKPRDDYAVSKVASTAFCLKEALFNTLPIYTIRPFLIYGDYEHQSRLIPSIMVNLLTGQPIKLSSPHNVRDFMYVDDLIDLYCAVMNWRGNEAHIFNGSTGQQHSIGDVVTACERVLNKKLDVTWGSVAQRPWEPTVWSGDSSLASRLLSWKRNYTLEAGLSKSYEWFKNNLHRYSPLPYAHQASKESNTSL